MSNSKGFLVKPAHLITNDGKSYCVIDNLQSDKKDQSLTKLPITNNKVYLITRGAVYEHLSKDFNVENIDPRFKVMNKSMQKNMKRKFERNISLMAHKPGQAPTKDVNYSKKSTAGSVIGL